MAIKKPNSTKQQQKGKMRRERKRERQTDREYDPVEEQIRARLVLQKSKRQHVTPLLKQLHWLPIQTRIDYKLATLAFRHFDGSLPQYLSSRLDTYRPSRSLRSRNDRLLRVPRWKLKSFRYRSFSYQGPVVWNSLPTDLKLSSSLASFKSKLKTHLFKKSYSLC